MTSKLTGKQLLTIRNLIQQFDFQTLFNQLGWDNASFNKNFSVKGKTLLLTAIAEKRGFVIFTCHADNLPNQSERKKVAQQIGKLYQEHIIIYYTANKQIWQISVKELNKPIQYRETEYHSHQQPDLLLSQLRGIFFTLDEEENIHFVDVTERVKSNFTANTEKTTKKFYDDFKKQHTAFMAFIQGLNKNLDDKRWYASLMLNRLMFIYFIQKKGFLDNDPHYLRHKLQKVKSKKGDDKFNSFYRNFLLQLFHYGLGAEHQQNKEITTLIGKIPYLNGGLFDVHELEKDDKNGIQISDEAFEKLFDFFDKYQWHLDTNINATGNEINPDVIGYIFEKYINDHATMGAYYTKEDITEYISKNTILPFLFDNAKTACANAFKTDSSLWQLLKDNPDRYIYDAVKKGCEHTDIPENIARGIDTDKPNLLERRTDWNTPTPEKFALPTEIWRETIARRQRYFELKAKLENGEISEINDFITYNLNIRQFAQDALEFYEGSDFIEAFCNAIESITVLDPTCGSGAFLFAALNILEPLYEGCINRMREFIENAAADKFKKFRAILVDIDTHANSTYWIYKKIILNNLYGVDIMQEAVEIAKLRLFLKLAAMAEVDYKKPNLGLEPLPDIDFNIRCGNTLIGYTTHEQIRKAVETDINGQTKIVIGDEMVLIDTMIEELQGVLRRYKDNQLVNNFLALSKDKQEIKDRLAEIQDQLDWFLARDYGVNADNDKQLNQWKLSHQPFHWFTEFFHIINKGGFDVIIGNPPYVEYSKGKSNYLIKGFETESCGNLYAFVMERAKYLSIKKSYIGMIVPISFTSTDGFSSLRKSLSEYLQWISNYAIRPAKLFEGVEHRLSIFIGTSGKDYYSTRYIKWSQTERFYLLQIIKYQNVSKIVGSRGIPKISSISEFNIKSKLKSQNNFASILSKSITEKKFYYTRKFGHFVVFTDFIPSIKFEDDSVMFPTELKHECLKSKTELLACISLFNSSFVYWYLVTIADCRNLNKRDILDIPIIKFNDNLLSKLSKLSESLMISFRANASHTKMSYPNQLPRIIEVIHPSC